MRVLLVCAGGMSTSMLMKKMSKYADEHGIELEIAARGFNEVKDGEGWDVVLLGPQIGYQADKLKAKLGDTPHGRHADARVWPPELRGHLCPHRQGAGQVRSYE